MEFCDCYDNSLPNFTQYIQPQGKKTCPKFIDSIYNCQYLIKKLFYNGLNDKECLEKCPKECHFVEYKTSVSYSKYPSDAYMQTLKDPNTTILFRNITDLVMEPQNIVSLNVFYKNSKYKEIEEQPALPVGIFVVNFGGTLGLFLGCSFLSFLEIIEIFIEVLYYYYYKLNNKK